VNPWWWVLIGLAAWFLVAIVVALLIGPVLRRSARSAQIQDSLRPEPEKTSDEGKPSADERQASL
jgi:UDP-N-acetylmuramyl pentapeptide phosphotransferase/UDP-N-acetylglucosamine-1-phosphate transferase